MPPFNFWDGVAPVKDGSCPCLSDLSLSKMLSFPSKDGAFPCQRCFLSFLNIGPFPVKDESFPVKDKLFLVKDAIFSCQTVLRYFTSLFISSGYQLSRFITAYWRFVTIHYKCRWLCICSGIFCVKAFVLYWFELERVNCQFPPAKCLVTQHFFVTNLKLAKLGLKIVGINSVWGGTRGNYYFSLLLKSLYV